MKKRKLSDIVYEQKLLASSIFCEVRQVYIKKEAEALFQMFNHKIYKASRIVQETFTFYNIFNLLIKLEFALLNHNYKGYYKFNLDSFFCDPCFLLYCYVLLKCGRLSKVYNVSVKRVTLSSIFLLSTKLTFKNYKPRPARRIFVKGFAHKMRPLSVTSALDAIVQKGLLILVGPKFEKQFLRCSYGFQKTKNCHVCLRSIYYT